MAIVEHPEDPHPQAVDVEGRIDGDCITVSVHDHGRWRDHRAKGDGGLGLVIESLMDTVDIERSENGTIVTMQRPLAAS
jgi:anti-sigma regulatory factor (Ser/Thr protein kinase)